jgi:hypothetical protein
MSAVAKSLKKTQESAKLNAHIRRQALAASQLEGKGACWLRFGSEFQATEESGGAQGFEPWTY